MDMLFQNIKQYVQSPITLFFQRLNTVYLNIKQYLQSIIAEFIAMTVFIYIGCGTVMAFLAPKEFTYSSQVTKDESYLAHIDSTFGVVVPFVFGLTVMVLAYAMSKVQAGQLNPAVTIGLVATCKMPLVHGVAMVIAQILASMLAVGFLKITIPNADDSTYGANSLSENVSVVNALIGETFLTFVLVLVVLLMDNTQNKAITAPIAIGFTVFVAHGVLLPLDGCSINPARSFGPAVASGTWKHFWIFSVAPIVGALVAVALFHTNRYFLPQEGNPSEVQSSNFSRRSVDWNFSRRQGEHVIPQQLHVLQQTKQQSSQLSQQQLQGSSQSILLKDERIGDYLNGLGKEEETINKHFEDALADGNLDE
eukprot:TRINITY_DN9155_c0_g1_i2.p1 TRINITY_DN9155_c0_g1~~TRINITY_DN9155_c0_g1_i2.p1  ORF type:complete len:366 (-),score=41.95 TRINITY_DN9155_c0_g1_i2:691-1788(-)